MKKIAILLPSLPVYRKDFFEKLNVVLSAKNIEFTVFNGVSNIKVIKSDETPVYLTHKLKTQEKTFLGFRLTLQKDLLISLKKFNPDGIIMLFNPGILSYLRVLIYCISRKIPYGLWSSGYVRPKLGSWQRGFRNIVLNYFNKRAKVHISYGKVHREELVNIGIKNGNIFVAQNTIYVEKIIDKNREAVYNRFGETLRILYVGAIIENKKLPATFHAVSSLIKEGLKIKYDIVGGGILVDGLRREIATLKMDAHIFVHGAKYDNDLEQFFINSDIFLMAGSGGLAINEAMAYGLPIISTVGDGTVSDLVQGNGFLLNNFGDVEEVKEKIRNFHTLLKEQKYEMSQRSIEIISGSASMENMVNKYSMAVDALFSDS